MCHYANWIGFIVTVNIYWLHLDEGDFEYVTNTEYHTPELSWEHAWASCTCGVLERDLMLLSKVMDAAPSPLLLCRKSVIPDLCSFE